MKLAAFLTLARLSADGPHGYTFCILYTHDSLANSMP